MTDIDNIDALLDDALEGKAITEDRLARTLNSSDGNERRSSRSHSREYTSRRRSSSRDRRRSTSREDRRRRDRSSDRRRSRSQDRFHRGGPVNRSYERRHSRDRPRVFDHRDRRPTRGRRTPPPRGRLPGPERRDVMHFVASRSPPKYARMDMSAQERDYRTIFAMQLARQTRPRDLEEFFSSVGHVRDIRLITDSRTGRSKGIAYIEFWDEESVGLGLALNGQKLLGAPLVIQRTCAERNRAAQVIATVGTALGFNVAATKGPVKLIISNLHPNIDENMMKSIFDPFGKVEACKLNKDNRGASIGVGYIIFSKSEDGHKASEHLNGFELAGNQIHIKIVDEEDTRRPLHHDERVGMVSGQVGRAQKLAGTDMVIHEAESYDPSIPAIATQCFVLSNMFDHTKESHQGWDEDVRQDVLEECCRHGGALHIYVDKTSEQGNVYVKCPNVSTAHKCVTALHGRWFSGKVITANYVPVDSYHNLFPDVAHTRQLLVPRTPISTQSGYGATAMYSPTAVSGGYASYY